MRIDAYTKFVLTVIALCLIWLSVGGPSLIPSISAQTQQARYASGYNRVVIAGWLDDRGGEHPLLPTRPDAAGTPSAPGLPVAVMFSR